MLVRVDEEMDENLRFYEFYLTEEKYDFKASEVARKIADSILEQWKPVQPGNLDKN